MLRRTGGSERGGQGVAGEFFGGRGGEIPKRLSSVLQQVIDRVHGDLDEHVSLLELYKPWFAGQLFVVTPDEATQWAASNFSSRNLVVCPSMYMHVHCMSRLYSVLRSSHYVSDGRPLDKDYTVATVADGAGAACGETLHVAGVLYHHMDMYVNPERILQMDMSSVWALWGGLVRGSSDLRSMATFCASGPDLEADHDWFWWDDSKNTATAAVNAAAAASGGLGRWPAGRVCRGMADTYYIPTGAMDAFVSITPHFQTVFHEVALQTMSRMAAAEAGVGVAELDCAGTCCSLVDVAVVGQVMCAHKVDLADPRVREVVHDFLNGTSQDAMLFGSSGCGVGGRW